MIIKEKIDPQSYGDFVKVAVDIDREILALGCLMHLDCAEELIGDGSEWKNVWGAGIYPKTREIDFTSLINIRPHIGNRQMEIQLPDIRKRVETIIKSFLA